MDDRYQAEIEVQRAIAAEIENLQYDETRKEAKRRLETEKRVGEIGLKRQEALNKAAIEAFGSVENYNNFIAQNPELAEEILHDGLKNYVKQIHTVARDPAGRFIKSPEGCKVSTKISEEQASGRLSSDDALQQRINLSLFGSPSGYRR